MTTVTDLLTDSLRTINAVDAVETPSADALATALRRLNGVIKEFSIYRGLAPYQVTETFNVTGGDGSYTFASGSDWDSARPTRIESAYYTLNGVDYSLDIHLGLEEYNEIYPKTVQGTPADLYFDPQITPVVKLWPVPASSGTVTVTSWKPLSEYTSGATTITLPGYWEELLMLGTAIALAPQYGKSPDPITVERYSGMRAHLRAMLSRPVRSTFGDMPMGSDTYDIDSDRAG
jgi:hypothetical protein